MRRKVALLPLRASAGFSKTRENRGNTGMSEFESSESKTGDVIDSRESSTGTKFPSKVLVWLALGLTVTLIFAIAKFSKDETSPEYLLNQMPVSTQVMACENALDGEDGEDSDYWTVDAFEEIVTEKFVTNNSPAITYSEDIYEDAYYSEYYGKSDYQRGVAASDIGQACLTIYRENTEFASAVDRIVEQKEAEAAAVAKQKAEEKAKIQPLLDKWNSKAIGEGGGDVIEYLAAEASAASQIKSGASYSFTGSTAQISSVTCYPTTLSRWVGGNPGGWWSCLIQTLGGDFDLYSIQFSGSSWGGKPDNGRMAGADLNWTIPESLLNWIRSSN
jgi:hypothetical protein